MIQQTRALWDEWSEDYQDDAEIHVTLQWGIDGPKESGLGLLGDLAGQDVLVTVVGNTISLFSLWPVIGSVFLLIAWCELTMRHPIKLQIVFRETC